jgi:hypothetical protein
VLHGPEILVEYAVFAMLNRQLVFGANGYQLHAGRAEQELPEKGSNKKKAGRSRG